MAHTETIAAIATPLGQGGVGIIRISGSDSKRILSALFLPSANSFTDFKPWVLHHGNIVDGKSTAEASAGTDDLQRGFLGGEVLDDVLAVYMPGPKTFTGEDVAEINCHGGPAILSAVLEAVFRCGARPAEPGEFTKRAFLNGRMDLTQAEAVAEMIAAPAREGLRLAQAKLDGLLGKRIAELRTSLEVLRMKLCVAVDFPEEEIECLSPQEFTTDVSSVHAALSDLLKNYDRAKCWRDGALVVLAGQVNAGKSSLMNGLLGRKRAIVTDVPGTTRDFLEEHLNFDGLPVRLVDTAGLRETGDIVEQEGVRMSRDLAAQADLVLLVVDARNGIGPHEQELVANIGADRVLLVYNKMDIVDGCPVKGAVQGAQEVCVSAKHGDGIDAVVTAAKSHVLQRQGSSSEPAAGDLVPNMRQSNTLREAADELLLLLDDIEAGLPYDLLGVRLETASTILSEITGETTPNEILNKIFDSFCIGK